MPDASGCGEALYDAEQRGELPQAAALASLGCGNPIAVAIFLKGVIEAIPLPADSVDVVISNCVVNLSTDKPAVLTEIARPEERAARGSYIGCVAGALSIAEYEAGLEAAGFESISVEPTHPVADGMHSAIIRARRTV